MIDAKNISQFFIAVNQCITAIGSSLPEDKPELLITMEKLLDCGIN